MTDVKTTHRTSRGCCHRDDEQWAIHLAAVRPGRLLVRRAADDGRCTGRIPGRIARRRNDITGRIGIIRRVRLGHGASRGAGVLFKRILSVRSRGTGAA